MPAHYKSKRSFSVGDYKQSDSRKKAGSLVMTSEKGD